MRPAWKICFSPIDREPGAGNERARLFKRSLAEFAVLGVLYFYKQFRRLVESQRQGKWDQFLVEWMPARTMGIIGYGEIGHECAL